MDLISLLIVYIVIASVAAIVANNKGRNGAASWLNAESAPTTLSHFADFFPAIEKLGPVHTARHPLLECGCLENSSFSSAFALSLEQSQGRGVQIPAASCCFRSPHVSVKN
jgi:hypothetical protein